MKCKRQFPNQISAAPESDQKTVSHLPSSAPFLLKSFILLHWLVSSLHSHRNATVMAVTSFVPAPLRPLRITHPSPWTSPQRRRAPTALATQPSAEPAFLSTIRDAASAPLAEKSLGIESLCWKAPVLRVCVTSLDDLSGADGADGATVDDCTFASTILGDLLDSGDYVPAEAYTLEVSTPGTKDVLTKTREFVAFKGFEVSVRTSEVFKKKMVFEGSLVERTERHVKINVKGRSIAIPREIVLEVRLGAAKTE